MSLYHTAKDFLPHPLNVRKLSQSCMQPLLLYNPKMQQTNSDQRQQEEVAGPCEGSDLGGAVECQEGSKVGSEKSTEAPFISDSRLAESLNKDVSGPSIQGTATEEQGQQSQHVFPVPEQGEAPKEQLPVILPAQVADQAIQPTGETTAPAINQSGTAGPNLQAAGLPQFIPPETQFNTNQVNPMSITSAELPSVVQETVLEVHFLYTLANLEENDAWEYLNLSINVTQNYAKDPSDTTPPPDNSAQTMQQLYQNSGPGGKHIKEVSVRINIKAPADLCYRRYKFQLFCSIEENQDVVQKMHDEGRFLDWSSMEAVVFISYPEKSRALHPISRTISRSVVINRILINEPNFFLGSFAYDGIDIYHDNPSKAVLEQKDTADPSDSAGYFPEMLSGNEKVIIVDVNDRVHEARKARAGRPSHRLTGQLLMTRAQARKVIEIRERWQGLTPRQRRNHVTERDFYSFLTLNRDEAARILPVCTTWFKDVIRLQGVRTWPGRPLRRSGALLEELKEQLCTEEAALKFEASKASYENRERNIARLRKEISKVLEERIAIVKKNVSAGYFASYERENGMQYLNPEWEALPPPVPDNERP